MTLTGIEIITKAQEILKTEGWTTGTMYDGKGYCAIGALRKVAFGNVYHMGTDPEFKKVINCLDDAASRRNASSIIWFNDVKAKSVDDVIELFEAAKECVK